MFFVVLSLSPIDVTFKNQKALGNKGLNNRGLFFTLLRHIKGCLIFSTQAYPNKNKDQDHQTNWQTSAFSMVMFRAGAPGGVPEISLAQN